MVRGYRWMYRTARPAIDMSTMPGRGCIFHDIGNYPSRDRSRYAKIPSVIRGCVPDPVPNGRPPPTPRPTAIFTRCLWLFLLSVASCFFFPFFSLLSLPSRCFLSLVGNLPLCEGIRCNTILSVLCWEFLLAFAQEFEEMELEK